MSGVRSGVGAENVPFRAAGDAVGILKEDVLFDPMCAEGTGKGEMQRGTSDPHKSASRDERPLRSVWGGSGGEEAGGSPQGRGSIQQQSLELDDVVRLLPPSRALASLYGRSEDGEALLVLQQAIESEISLHHASGTLAEVWASLGPKEKDRIRERVGFDAARWELVVPFPLSSGEPARVGRLRGYGNSLCAPVAQAFIEAVMLVR